jgi:hypothetical protein
LREESDDICQVCSWQEDIVQREDSDYVGGPNMVSLNQARESFRLFGVSEKRFIGKGRKPLIEEFDEGCSSCQPSSESRTTSSAASQ